MGVQYPECDSNCPICAKKFHLTKRKNGDTWAYVLVTPDHSYEFCAGFRELFDIPLMKNERVNLRRITIEVETDDPNITRVYTYKGGES